MDHNHAVHTMAAERYLLNELTPEEREAFEAHFFSCADCAAGLRAAAAFLQEARAQLHEFATASPACPQPVAVAAGPRPLPVPHPSPHRSWWRPAVVIPAFLALFAFLGYQSLMTLKAMRSGATQPRIIPRVELQAGGAVQEQVPVPVTRGRGVVLLIDFPRPASAYASYVINLQYPEAAQDWIQTVSAASAGSSSPLSLFIPAAGLQSGPYHLIVYGVTPQGRRALLDRSTLNVEFYSAPKRG